MRDVRAQLADLNQKLADGRLSLHDWQHEFYKVLQDGHYKAALLGTSRAGQKKIDSTALQLMAKAKADEEMHFLSGFAASIHLKDPRYVDENGNIKPGSLESRTDLYVGKMRGTANEAFGEASKEDALWTWVLGPELHCPDCPHWASIVVKVLWSAVPTTPGAGDTACLGHCGCELVRDDGVTGFGNTGAHQLNGIDDQEQEVAPALPKAPGGNGGSGGAPPVPPSPPTAQGNGPDWSNEPSALSDLKSTDAYADKLLNSLKSEMDQALRGPSPNSKVSSHHMGPGNLGSYSPSSKDILIDPAQEQGQKHMTLAHEIGHAIDYQILQHQGVPASVAAVIANSGPLKEWATAVEQSKPIQALLYLKHIRPDLAADIDDYPLAPWEVWARSFAQYFATKSKSRRIKSEFKIAMQETFFGQIPAHWTDKEFKPIEDAIDKCLRAAGYDVR